MIGFLVASAALFGLLIGSFLNVVAYRVPAGLSVVRPASSCPGCSTAIAPRDNVPLLSWLLLRGACRHCGMRISARYPIVEAGTAAAFALATIPFANRLVATVGPLPTAASSLELIAFLFLAAVSVVLAVIDLSVWRLPDRIVLPAYAVGAVLLGGAGALRGDLAALGVAAAGSGSSFLFFLTLHLAKPRGMGLGDVKLAGVLGLFLGYLGSAELVVGLAAGFLLGGLFGVALIVARRSAASRQIPFGPWMLGGAWIGVLAGDPIARAYLTLTGLA